ncbi:MAG: hypothetical protein ACYYK0_00710 [Candidatus Eutrophobiaceae bacterium]
MMSDAQLRNPHGVCPRLITAKEMALKFSGAGNVARIETPACENFKVSAANAVHYL